MGVIVLTVVPITIAVRGGGVFSFINFYGNGGIGKGDTGKNEVVISVPKMFVSNAVNIGGADVFKSKTTIQNWLIIKKNSN